MLCFISFFPPRVRTRTETPSDSTGPASASASSEGEGETHANARLERACSERNLCVAGADQNRLLRRPVPPSVPQNFGREADMPCHR